MDKEIRIRWQRQCRQCPKCKHFWLDRIRHGCILDSSRRTYTTYELGSMWAAGPCNDFRPICPPEKKHKIYCKFIQFLRVFFSHIVLCFRPFAWIFRRDWYSIKRWGTIDYETKGKTWLIDVGAITFGWRDNINAKIRRNEN
jgi:Zn-finger nucleic acid-binding protein